MGRKKKTLNFDGKLAAQQLHKEGLEPEKIAEKLNVESVETVLEAIFEMNESSAKHEQMDITQKRTREAKGPIDYTDTWAMLETSKRAKKENKTTKTKKKKAEYKPAMILVNGVLRRADDGERPLLELGSGPSATVSRPPPSPESSPEQVNPTTDSPAVLADRAKMRAAAEKRFANCPAVGLQGRTELAVAPPADLPSLSGGLRWNFG